MEDGVFEVKATAGKTHLGGEDFDQRLIAYCVGEFKKKTKLDIGDNKRCLARLRGECERAKRALSANTIATGSLDKFY